MSEYSKQELEEAIFAISSVLKKCEKIEKGEKLPPSQKTLLERRVRALRISLELLEKETGRSEI